MLMLLYPYILDDDATLNLYMIILGFFFFLKDQLWRHSFRQRRHGIVGVYIIFWFYKNQNYCDSRNTTCLADAAQLVYLDVIVCLM